MNRIVACLFLLATFGAAAPSEKVERPPLRELVAFREKPKYAVFRFGDKKPRYVWMAWDGDRLYVDRDANDEIDHHERVDGVRKAKRPDFLREGFTFNVGTIGPWTGAIVVSISRYNKNYKSDRRSFAEELRNRDDPHVAFVYFYDAKKKLRRFAMTVLQEDRAQAPLIHVDGPLSIGRVQSLGELTLYAGEENDFRVSLGTPGEGKASFSFAMYDGMPAAVRPRATVRFPDGKGGLQPPQTFKLKDKCWGYIYYGPVRAPKRMKGTAEVTLFFEGEPGERVARRTIQVPVW